jgi:predicted CoA-substrate-specific enzyme activase
MARILGIDIGSRSVDAVWLEDGRVLDSVVLDSGFDPQEVAAGLAARAGCDLIVATGYGRHAAAANLGAEVITEIKAYGLGAWSLFPGAATVLDVGGQDTKVVLLGSDGRVADFEMNDKCAAGTGRFLEVMARVLGYNLEEMGRAALDALGDGGAVKISSMCTVFAESEVTGLLHRGEDRSRIALGLHESISRRTLGMLKRVGARSPLVFGGGVAKNAAMVRLLGDSFSGEIFLPAESQTVGALGAALHGQSLLARAPVGGPAFGRASSGR